MFLRNSHKIDAIVYIYVVQGIINYACIISVKRMPIQTERHNVVISKPIRFISRFVTAIKFYTNDGRDDFNVNHASKTNWANASDEIILLCEKTSLTMRDRYERCLT